MPQSNTIKVFYPNYYPAVSDQCGLFPPLHVTKSCLYPGTMVEIIHELTKYANLTIQPLTSLDFGYQRNELDDIGPLIYDLLENGTIDIFAQALQQTDMRNMRFTFTNPIYRVQNRVIHRTKDTQYEQFWSFFNTYDSFTWVLFLTAWLLQLAFCLVTQRCEARLEGKKAPNVGEQSVFTISISIYMISVKRISVLLVVALAFILASTQFANAEDKFRVNNDEKQATAIVDSEFIKVDMALGDASGYAPQKKFDLVVGGCTMSITGTKILSSSVQLEVKEGGQSKGNINDPTFFKATSANLVMVGQDNEGDPKTISVCESKVTFQNHASGNATKYLIDIGISGQIPPRFELSSSAFQILRIQLLQPEASSTVQFRTIAGKFSLFFFSLVQCSILLGVFSSFVLANIIKSYDHKEKDSIYTIINGIKKKEMYVTGTHSHKWIFELINSSSEFPFLEIHQGMAGNPMRIRPNINDVIDLVSKDNGIIFNQEDDRSFFQGMSRCNLVSVFDNMPQVYAYLMMRKKSPFLDKINGAIEANKIMFNSIASKYLNKALSQSHCNSKKKVKPLKLAPYGGLLIICLVVFSMAFMILLFEIMITKQMFGH